MSLILDKINYYYGKGTAFESKALKNISLSIPDGEFIGLIGHTGSGKSTLIQHMNGLIKADFGNVYYNGQDIYDKDFKMTELRRKVGLVFQYPEHQLFEEDVFSDVCFGPTNLGLARSEVELRAYNALKAVGIGDDQFYVSPFDLSGGEKRRVAIAGVLAMKPEILILDEPCAGLDPKGRDEILGMADDLHDNYGITIIIVSHSMEDLAEHAKRLLVMNEGELVMDGTARQVFSYRRELEDMGLAVPCATAVMSDLRAMGLPVRDDLITIEEAEKEILRLFGR